MKIISIIAFAPRINLAENRFKDIYEYTEHYQKNVGRVEYLDIDEPIKRVFFYDEFALNQAERLVPFYDGEDVQIELWRPYQDISKVYSKEIAGVNCKLIPANTYKDRLGRKRTKSDLMISMLKEEIKKGAVLITNFPSNYTQYILDEIGNKAAVVTNKRGFWFENFKADDVPFLKLPYHWNKKRKQERLLKKGYIDQYGSVSITTEIDYLESLGFKNYFYHQDGVDFNFFKPVEDKAAVRKELGLDPSKKMVMYTGKFYKTKGADKLIDAYNGLPNKSEIQLVMIGGGETDEFYQYGKESGVTMVEKTHRSRLLKYYQATDVYIMPIVDHYVKHFGGMGRSTIEALACGAPVMTDQLMHFEGGKEEAMQVGRMLEYPDKMVDNLYYLLEHNSEFTQCRELAEKYYNMDRCTLRIKEKIDLLYKQYYS